MFLLRIITNIYVMGWTGLHFSGNYNELVRHEFNRNGYEIQVMEILPSLQKGRRIAYVAMKHPDGYVFGLVILLEKNVNGKVIEFLYKDVCESMGPSEDNCPLSVLSKLSPLENLKYVGDSEEWRCRCYANLGLNFNASSNDSVKQLSLFV